LSSPRSPLTGALSVSEGVVSPADVRLALPARPPNVAVVRQALAGVADALEVDVALAADMKIALTEACTNAVLHAYDTGEGPLEVDMRVEGPRLTISVRDRGPGFKPLPAIREEAPLGFGLALIASLSDAFAIQGGAAGTEVQMTFELGPEVTDGAPPPSASQLREHRPHPPSEAVQLRVAQGPLVAPVLSRVVSLLAARADFSIDRLSDAQIVSDALAQHAGPQTVDGFVGIRIDEVEGALEVRVGPLSAGGGDALVAASELPGLGQIIPRLAGEVSIESLAEEPPAEVLRLRLTETPPVPD
jgi:serine/threonine-protein kinase RsbW